MSREKKVEDQERMQKLTLKDQSQFDHTGSKQSEQQRMDKAEENN